MATADYYDDGVLTNGHILTTTVSGGDNDSQSLTSSLDLNTMLGNNNGVFSWGGTNFSNGAQNVKFTDGCQLEADLPDSNGNLAHSVVIISSVLVQGDDGKYAIQHTAGVVYSEAHAVANTNEQADSAVASQAQTTNPNSSITQVTTVKGDASQYWPNGNAPASYFFHEVYHTKAKKITHQIGSWVNIFIAICECFS